MKLLLIEDEVKLAKSIQEYLNASGFLCEWANDFSSAIEKIALFDYDCILLDLTLPDGDGFDILIELKKQHKTDGVIIISAKETIETRIEGFNLGADDYLTKPFHLSELLVRIQAIIRRKQFNGSNTISFNEIEIDVLSKVVKINDQKVDITKKEIDLLLYLIGNKNKVLSKGAIAEHLSGDMADMLDNHDFVYAHIKNLKKKLTYAKSKNYIKSVYGLGYKWQDE
ncbi:Transcriptional regulatory protein QseB [Polaribacter huanghezhanensis]|uniref:response regulator transcription factor n=1 Tax=Polaribacter huanghezhanensis TaxID=1354726 RepID=UPI002647F57E|nr:response regulator transcription factor [Polaribacter huanghezhanensis]WKD86654.1 Transcriptional regulatory protein QseB [Polaribacter huanghezhanensis]